MGNLKQVGGRLVRPAFKPEHYTAPADIVDRLKSWEPQGGSEDLWEEQEHHGPFAGLFVHERREHDGERWMVLVSPEGWALEVELTRNRPFEVRPLPPDEAWLIARAQDARWDPPIEIEP